ncbi:MAG: 50S ribosomal protein L31e, partial [Candidatus Nanohaloarchaeota archaeon]|nr:50S ribosomal protein L31e [Candidatus Nanohaloarchaeota archaeon]
MVLERVYVVPLKKAWNSAYHKRTKRAVKILKDFAIRHMKSEVIKIENDLNKYLWRRGNANPPRKIKVVMIKYDTGEVL